MSKSETVLAQRIARLPLTVPAALPIADKAAEIVAALAQSQVLVVAGETGSGKTTQLPKLCLQAGLGRRGIIGHTQPRRLAARAVASRLAQELQVPLGDAVGYSVRFTDRTSEQTLIKLMTDGLLLAEIQADRLLRRYEVLIIDEAHERSLNIDFLLGYLKTLLTRRPDLKVIITSATIDVQAFAQHFDAPVVEVSGRGYPVAVEYFDEPNDNVEGLSELVMQCVARMEAATNRAGQARDALVFLSGEREIFNLARELRTRLSDRWELLPLYARLPASEQQRVFSSSSKRRLVLCTNVAETSLTVPNIGFVIDTGLARVSRYSYRSKLQRLPIEAISKASANQRLGRCGRIAPGVCYRLYAESDFLGRPDYTDPEIKRTNLAAVVLQMEVFRLGRIERFPFLEPPEPGAVRAAIRLLEELEAFDKGKATPLGRQMARLPVDPRLARMLLEGARQGALNEVLTIVSALSVQDPRERPQGQRGQADARHEQFADERSDFMAWLNLWTFSEIERQQLSRRRYERLLRSRFLSASRMREWREVHRQLRLACQSLRLTMNQVPADYSAIHRSLLVGSLGFVGRHEERGEFEGTGNLKFRIFPGSALFEQRPKWLMAAEISQTQKVYARCVARIEPAWIETQAAHLLKRQHSEPHFSVKRGEAMAYEKVSFRGLTLVERRRVSYTRIDPDLSRALFIREGLVAGALRKRPPFLDSNLAKVRGLLEEEAKARRRDVLISAEEQLAWYEQRLPPQVNSERSLLAWLRRRPENDQQLRWRSAELRRTAITGLAAYPAELQIEDQAFCLRYKFAPGEVDDGVSLEVPLGRLNALHPETLAWGVPGTFAQICEQWLKSLPKHKRRDLAPLADKNEAVANRLLSESRYRKGQLRQALARVVGELYDVNLQPSDFQPERVDSHLLINVRLLDSKGRLLEQSRDLADVQRRHEARLSAELAAGKPAEFEQDTLVAFPDALTLPPCLTLAAGTDGGDRMVYPGFEDQGETVALRAYPTASSAAQANRLGLPRLALLAMTAVVRKIRKRLREERDLQLHYASFGSKEQLETHFLLGAAWNCFFADKPWPEHKVAFADLLERGESLPVYVDRVLPLLRQVLAERFAAGRQIEALQSPAFVATRADLQAHLAQLAPPELLLQASEQWLAALPRYFQAMGYRMQHLQGRVQRDQEAMAEIATFETRLQRLNSVQQFSQADFHVAFTALQELRVALFADPLRKPKVSAKRLDRLYREYEVRHALV